ncbi:hypothetical protein JK628_03885 [Shewanella sp. KX20019]|uniref:hypothetical protein n=1 Tax=Shewanella sp. KX20019 TaxID=2803864 RepID=UPI00192527A0|nr:hypothetical protein [Shewanella sp. KX20019]QQX81022.1 hypothetical protein JK628_03885 [Shewanella sp. KX20019]
MVNKLVKIIESEGAINGVEVAILNGVRVESMLVNQLDGHFKKTDKTTMMVQTSHPDMPSVGVSLDGGGSKESGVGVFQKGTGEPYASFVDKDGDGVFDLLMYSALDRNGKRLLEVEDYGMDGQADFKLNLETGVASIYFEGQWYQSIAEVAKDKYFLINNEKVSIRVAVRRMRALYGF